MTTIGKHLRPDRHPQMDLFIADILDAAPKDDLGSMEHPLFALQGGDRRIRRYEHRGTVVEVIPSAMGLATIFDKDILIYVVSQLVEALNRGREDVSRTVRITAYDLLVTTNRRTDGDAYQRLQDALTRLRGTTVTTNILSDGQRAREGFGLIDRYKIVEYSGRDRMSALEVTISEWLFRAVRAREVLTISRDYFRLRKPLDRRVYEICRKHCGTQRRWAIAIDTLRRKSGSTASIKEFRRAIKSLAESNQLPDYRIHFDAGTDTLAVYARSEKGGNTEVPDTLKDAHLSRGVPFVSKKKGQGASETEAAEPSDRNESRPFLPWERNADDLATTQRLTIQGAERTPMPSTTAEPEPPSPARDHPEPTANDLFPAAVDGTSRPPAVATSADTRVQAMEDIWAALGRRRPGARS